MKSFFAMVVCELGKETRQDRFAEVAHTPGHKIGNVRHLGNLLQSLFVKVQYKIVESRLEIFRGIALTVCFFVCCRGDSVHIAGWLSALLG